MSTKTFRAVILHPPSATGTEKLIVSTSAADARKTAKRIAEELQGRVFSFERVIEGK